MSISANVSRRLRGTRHISLRTVVTGGDFTGWRGMIVNISSAGVAIAGGDTAGARCIGILIAATELRPGVEGLVPTGTVLTCESGQEEWFPIGSGTFAGTVVGLDACILNNRQITTGTVATNDVRLGEIIELETFNAVAGAWVHVGYSAAGIT